MAVVRWYEVRLAWDAAMIGQIAALASTAPVNARTDR